MKKLENDISRQCKSHINNTLDAQQTIRTIGDHILHSQAVNVAEFSKATREKIDQQISIMKRCLSEAGGAGIAANQCSELGVPLNIVLVGINHDDPEHVAKVTSRYPDTLFPALKILVNPEIIWTSQELDVFPEGCLSVQGPMRALMLRPRDVKVRYQDIDGNYYEELFTGAAARVVLHELDHIIAGKVYFQRILEELELEDLQCLQNIIKKIKSRNKNDLIESSASDPVLVFKRDANNCLIYDTNEVQNLFEKINTNVLNGIYWSLVEAIKLKRL